MTAMTTRNSTSVNAEFLPGRSLVMWKKFYFAQCGFSMKA